MSDPQTSRTTSDEHDAMHSVYRAGGQYRQMAPHVVYSEALCPHSGCGCRLQAIDFRLEEHGPSIHDRLVKAWWDDTGFAGRCPSCGDWIHFTIQQKQAITAEQADRLPSLPDNWHEQAVIL